MTLLKERKLSLTKLAQREDVNTTTAWRWAKRGVRGVKLETFNVGGRRWTTEEAFMRFVEATTAAAQGQSVCVKSGRGQLARVAAAEKELAKAGI